MAGELKKSVSALETKTGSELKGTQLEFAEAIEALQKTLSEQAAASHQEVQDLEIRTGEKMGSTGSDSEARMDELQGNMERMRMQILGDEKNDGDLKKSIKELHDTINSSLDGTQSELGAAVESVAGQMAQQVEEIKQQLTAHKELEARELSDAVAGCEQATKAVASQLNHKVDSNNTELTERLDDLQGKHLAMRFQILGDEKNDGDLKKSIIELHETINSSLDGTQSELSAAIEALQKALKQQMAAEKEQREKELSEQKASLTHLGSELMGSDDADSEGGGKLSELKGAIV